MRKLRANLMLRNKVDQAFDIDKLKSEKSMKYALEHCLRSLKLLGNGTSRAVFELDSRRIVKIALNSQGCIANKLEAKHSQATDIVPKSSLIDENGICLAVQKVVPLSNQNVKTATGLHLKVFLSLVTAICREESLDEETRKWWDGAQVLKSYLRLDLAKQLLSNVVQGDNKLLKDFAEGLAKFLKSMSSNVERTIVSADLCHRVLNFGYDAVGKRLLVIDSGIDVRSTTYLDMKLGQARTSRILARLQLSSEDILALRQRRIEQKEQRRKANG